MCFQALFSSKVIFFVLLSNTILVMAGVENWWLLVEMIEIFVSTNKRKLEENCSKEIPKDTLSRDDGPSLTHDPIFGMNAEGYISFFGVGYLFNFCFIFHAYLPTHLNGDYKGWGRNESWPSPGCRRPNHNSIPQVS